MGDNGEQLLHDLTAAATAAGDQDLEAPEEEGAERAYRNMQSALCDCLAEARSTVLRTQLTAIADEKERFNALAQHRSQSDKGAMAYLTVDPNNDRMRTIAAAPLREAMRRSLRIIRPATGGLCGNVACPQDMDGEHALACMLCATEQTARHEFIKHALVALAKRVSVHATKEDSTPFVGTARPDRRMDIVIAGGQMKIPLPMRPDGTLVPNVSATARDRGLLVDVFWADPTAQRYRRKAAQEDGAALVDTTREKYTRYGDDIITIAFTLIPFGVEILGRICRHAHAYVRSMAFHETSASDGAYPYSSIMMKWRQYISTAVQRAVSESVARSMSKSRAKEPIADHPFDRDAHMQVRLLNIPVAVDPPVAVEAAP